MKLSASADPSAKATDARAPARTEGWTVARPDGSTDYKVSEPDGACHVYDGDGERLKTEYEDHGHAVAHGVGTAHEEHTRRQGRVSVTSYGWQPRRPPTIRIAPRKTIVRRRGGCERRPGRRVGSSSRSGSGGGSSGDPDPPSEPATEGRGGLGRGHVGDHDLLRRVA
jgi:hypothetical protein